MKNLTFLVGLFLAGISIANGQQPEWKTIYSDEFHFIATFPGDPEQKSEDIDTSFGSGSVRRWISELPGISYEVLVADFPNLSVKMEYKELDSFYNAVCIELGSAQECRGGLNNDQFGELGKSGGFRTIDGTVEFLTYLAGKRLYMATVVTRTSMVKQTREDRKEFLDKFLFAHLVEAETGKKLKWGLPTAGSQNRENN
jgi:hypothetical protein